MRDVKIIDNKYLKLESTYSTLPKKLFSKQYPDDVGHPELVIFNDSLSQDLGLDESFLKSSEGVDFLCGNKVLESSKPISQAYAGHQFGHFTMLGDGRAVLLGELVTERGKRFDLQLKGSGITPYSRGGDGKAALGPMLREYIISEAMNALKIRTTRSLAVVKTGENILRESGENPGAVLARIAESHIRVGTFQYAIAFCGKDTLKALADYTLERHFKIEEGNTNSYLFLLQEVIKRQAELIAKWQSVGFIHGVMNTDNMSICGETIDYGPCAFMDTYNPDTVFSSIDTFGRYAYKNQPLIGAWNLARFAETLIPIISDDEDKAVKEAQNSLENFKKLYEENWYKIMRNKLGLFDKEDGDVKLIDDLLNLMLDYRADYTNTFLELTLGNLNKINMFKGEDFKKWYKLWQDRLDKQGKSKDDVEELMKRSNPTVIPRNDKVEEALNKAVNEEDYSGVKSLLEVINNPYDYGNINEYYSQVPKERKIPYKTYCGT